MRIILNHKGTEYGLMSEFLEMYPDYRNIWQRKEFSEDLFVFHKKTYITWATKEKMLRIIELERDYYSAFGVCMRFGDIMSFDGLKEPLLMTCQYTSYEGCIYIKKTDVDKFVSLGEIFSTAYSIPVITAAELVHYYNTRSEPLYHRDNLTISSYHIQYMYPYRRIKTLNGQMCVALDRTVDVYEEFVNLCRTLTEMDFFDNFFVKKSGCGQTYIIMREFYITILSKSRNNRRPQYATALLNKLFKIYNILEKEIYLYSKDWVCQHILNSEDLGTDPDLIKFLKYVKMKNPSFLRGIELGFRANNKITLYSTDFLAPEHFAALYYATTQTENHIKKAYDNHMYAQYWLYILILLTNFTRTEDVVMLPVLELPYSYEDGFFLDERIRPEVAEDICFRFKEKAKKILIAKNRNIKDIYILEDQKEALAVALYLCNSFAKKRNLRRVFTFRNVNSERIYQAMGEPYSNISDRRLNYSLATYFYRTNIEDNRYRESVDRHLSIMRGHRLSSPLDRSSVTTKYIKQNNQDPSVEVATYHLMQRGPFGWLYHLFLSLIGIETKSVEEETDLIDVLSRRMDFFGIEQISDFLLNEKKEQADAYRLLAMFGKDELVEFLGRIGTCGTYRTNENLPCIFAQGCPRPDADCKFCPLSMKTISAMYDYAAELRTVIRRLREETNKNLIWRDSELLFRILRVFKQCQDEFGKEYVQVFVDLDTVHNQMKSIPVSVLAVMEEYKDEKSNEKD